MPITSALNEIDSLTQKYDHKKNIFDGKIRGNIGINIEREFYRKAMEKIVLRALLKTNN